jgi:hypothetical protein
MTDVFCQERLHENDRGDTGMSSKPDTGQAVVLTERRLREGVSKNNLEVLLVMAAALNPMMFSDKVDFLRPTDPADEKNYVVIRISETGNAYAIHFDTVAKLAIQLQVKTGMKSEVLDRITWNENVGQSSYVQ